VRPLYAALLSQRIFQRVFGANITASATFARHGGWQDFMRSGEQPNQQPAQFGWRIVSAADAKCAARPVKDEDVAFSFNKRGDAEGPFSFANSGIA
jgi:hypothetical protein